MRLPTLLPTLPEVVCAARMAGVPLMASPLSAWHDVQRRKRQTFFEYLHLTPTGVEYGPLADPLGLAHECGHWSVQYRLALVLDEEAAEVPASYWAGGLLARLGAPVWEPWLWDLVLPGSAFDLHHFRQSCSKLQLPVYGGLLP